MAEILLQLKPTSITDDTGNPVPFNHPSLIIDTNQIFHADFPKNGDDFGCPDISQIRWLDPFGKSRYIHTSSLTQESVFFLAKELEDRAARDVSCLFQKRKYGTRGAKTYHRFLDVSEIYFTPGVDLHGYNIQLLMTENLTPVNIDLTDSDRESIADFVYNKLGHLYLLPQRVGGFMIRRSQVQAVALDGDTATILPKGQNFGLLRMSRAILEKQIDLRSHGLVDVIKDHFIRPDAVETVMISENLDGLFSVTVAVPTKTYQSENHTAKEARRVFDRAVARANLKVILPGRHAIAISNVALGNVTLERVAVPMARQPFWQLSTRSNVIIPGAEVPAIRKAMVKAGFIEARKGAHAFSYVSADKSYLTNMMLYLSDKTEPDGFQTIILGCQSSAQFVNGEFKVIENRFHTAARGAGLSVISVGEGAIYADPVKVVAATYEARTKRLCVAVDKRDIVTLLSLEGVSAKAGREMVEALSIVAKMPMVTKTFACRPDIFFSVEIEGKKIRLSLPGHFTDAPVVSIPMARKLLKGRSGGMPTAIGELAA